MAKFKFTKKAIESLTPPEKGTAYHYDTVNRGLALSVSPKGVKTFLVYRKINGRPERISLGRFPDLSVETATGKAHAVNASIAQGENPADKNRADRKEMIFTQLFDEYLERHSKPHKKTWKRDKELFDRYLSIPLGKRKLSTITRLHIAEIHSRITKNAPTMANRVLALVSSIFGRAVEWGLYEDLNPARGIRRNRERARDRFIQSCELKYFFEAVAMEPNETIRDYVLISLLTGARRSNVLAMQWNDLNLDSMEWHIPETKNGTPQTVPLSPEAVSILRQRHKSKLNNFVFPGSGKLGYLVEPKKGWARILNRAKALGFIRSIATVNQWDENKLKHQIRLIMENPDQVIDRHLNEGKQADIEPEQFKLADLRIHDLRRTLGSWQAKAGASLSVIGKSLNHKSVDTTAIYARLDLDPVRDSVNRATSDMLGAAGFKSVAEVVKLK